LELRDSVSPHFKTRRLYLRRYEQADENDLYRAARASIGDMFEFLPWCHPDYSKNEAKNWLKTTVTSWRAGTAYHFAIFDKDRETFHGGCSLECNNDHPTANLGYWVQSASTGQGICTEAAIGLADFGHRELGLQRVEIIMSTKNTKSRRVAEKTGALFEGKLRNRLRLHNKCHDAFIFSLVPGDIP
jgi:ribosomal-protein-serine acetyltransferase|tara:strand:+ start:155 stop:715 length:561 start_codon:yes stop_codon:yes gene_type:complete